MEKQNLISIVIPTFNSERYLEEAIISIISQKVNASIEIIIVDGKSDDATFDIIKRYDALLKDRKYPILCCSVYIKWISEKDNGMYDAINKGFGISSGDIMTYMGSDDKLLDDTLSVVVSIFKANENVEWLTGWPTYINEGGGIFKYYKIQGYCKEFISKGYYRTEFLHYIQQEGTFWTRGLWERAGKKMNVSLKYEGDFELSSRLAGYAILYTAHRSMVGFRMHVGQLTDKFMDKYNQEAFSISNNKPSIWEYIIFKIYKIYNNIPTRFRIAKFMNNKMPHFEFDGDKWIKK